MSPSGALVRQVAIGLTDRDHTSVDVDPTGHRLLYLAGPDLYVSQDGRTPTRAATGLQAASWAQLPPTSCRAHGA